MLPAGDVMTYVDMVFPAFLFILGMAIPLATEQRLRKDPSMLHLGFTSCCAPSRLLVLGLILDQCRRGQTVR